MPDQRDDEQREEGLVSEPQSGPTPLIDESAEPIVPRVASPDGDDEEETWTNQPTSQKAVEDEALDEEDDDEDAADAQPATRKVIQNGRDVLCEELPSRAQRAKLRMKPHLTCSLVVELVSSGEKFLFDWKGEEPKVEPVTGSITTNTENPGDSTVVDSIIALTEQHLMSIRSGDLNPQVAMLADKIKVKGKVGPAVYLFNLIAPRYQQ